MEAIFMNTENSKISKQRSIKKLIEKTETGENVPILNWSRYF